MTYNTDESVVVYHSDDNTLRLDVQMADETVWLSTGQMSVLFDKEESNIRRHIINIFKEGELFRENNVRFLHVNAVKKPVPFYSLDVIISVGYRVKSKRGVLFRQWANRILKDYLLRGYAFNQRFERIEHRLANMEERQSHFEMEIQTSLPPHEGIFIDGQIYDAFEFVTNLIGSANKSVLLIDNYVDENVLTMLTNKKKHVLVSIYTRTISEAFRLAVDKYNEQYGGLTLCKTESVHDRFLIIDDKEIYFIGASLKDLGRKLFAFSKMEPRQIEVLKHYLMMKKNP